MTLLESSSDLLPPLPQGTPAWAMLAISVLIFARPFLAAGADWLRAAVKARENLEVKAAAHPCVNCDPKNMRQTVAEAISAEMDRVCAAAERVKPATAGIIEQTLRHVDETRDLVKSVDEKVSDLATQAAIIADRLQRK